ncbi:hypothetical protein Tco_0160679, partial [Tanacetum coccineum]
EKSARGKMACSKNVYHRKMGGGGYVTPMGAYEVDGTQSSVVVHDKDVRIKKKSNGLVTSEKVMETMVLIFKFYIHD